MSHVSPLRALLLPALLASVLLVVLLSLGVWQLQRKTVKEALIAQVERRAKAPAVPLAEAPPNWRTPEGAEAAEFSRVTAVGHFDHAREYHLLSPRREGAAWMIVTRFETAKGPLLVMRGIAPDAMKDPARRAAGQVPDEIAISGRIRLSEPKGWFTPANDVERNHWFARDLAGMQRAAGLDEAGRAFPFFIELERPPPPGGLPRPSLDAVNLRNDHLQYALTWFALAGVLVAMFFVWARAQSRIDSGGASGC